MPRALEESVCPMSLPLGVEQGLEFCKCQDLEPFIRRVHGWQASVRYLFLSRFSTCEGLLFLDSVCRFALLGNKTEGVASDYLIWYPH